MNTPVRHHRLLRMAARLAVSSSLVVAVCAAAVPASPSASVTGQVGFLKSVSALSRSQAWAVGDVALHWNGTTWTKKAIPEPGGAGSSFLQSVSTVSPSNAWAVGSYLTSAFDKTLILHWNGIKWARVASPNPGPDNYLSGVSAVSPSNIWAVGFYYTSAGGGKTLILHWNGTTWAKVASPNPGPADNELSGVSAVSPSNIWAVGFYYTSAGNGKTLILHWNGTTWAKVASPSPGRADNYVPAGNFLYGVSAVSPSNIWAVGYYRYRSGDVQDIDNTLILHWNGTKWAKVASPNPVGDVGSEDSLHGVSAVSPSNAWAVGGMTGHGGYEEVIVLHWNGSSWIRS